MLWVRLQDGNAHENKEVGPPTENAYDHKRFTNMRWSTLRELKGDEKDEIPPK